MATLAPSAARRLAIAAPIPREPPVTRATLPSSFLDIAFLLFCEGLREMGCSAGQMDQNFVSWGAMLLRHERRCGTPAPSILRCRRRGRKPHGGGEDETAHVTAFLEPANPGSRGRDWHPTADAASARHRIDSGGSRFSRS